MPDYHAKQNIPVGFARGLGFNQDRPQYDDVFEVDNVIWKGGIPQTLTVQNHISRKDVSHFDLVDLKQEIVILTKAVEDLTKIITEMKLKDYL